MGRTRKGASHASRRPRTRRRRRTSARCPSGTWATSTPRRRRSELNADTEWLRGECRAFARDYEGKLAALDTAGLLAAIRRYERIETVSGRIMSYAGLRYYQMTTDAVRAKFFGDTPGRADRDHHAAGLLHAGAEPDRRRGARRGGGGGPGAGALQAGARPHPQDEAVSALRRAGAVPARPVGGGGGGLEPALRRDDGGARDPRWAARR